MVNVRGVQIDNNNPFVLIAGQCVIEDISTLIQEAKEIKKITESLKIPFIYKVSYDKANRSSISSYRGPGIEKGLEIIKQLRREVDVPILTDIHLPSEAERVAEYVDVIQIPAFLCRQTDLLLAAAKTGKPVNIKKGQFLSPEEMKSVIEKVYSTGNTAVMVTERGTTFGYNNLVVDMRSLAIMKRFNVPVVFDATHSVQKPGMQLSDGRMVTSGQREFVPVLARAATAVGVAGIYMEVHPEPKNAKSDAANQWPLDLLKELLHQLKKIDEVVKNFREFR